MLWEFHDRTPKSTHGELVVHVLSFDGKSRIPPRAVDGPKMNDVPGRLAEHYYSHGDGSRSKILLCTEYKRDAYIFRCHPHYRNSGPWYDWLWVRFTMDDGTTELDYPCRVVGIIPMEANGLEETELMVQACLDRTQVHQDRDSVLFQEWEIDHDTYYFIPASSIVKPAFVIGDLSDAVPDKKRVPKPTKRKRRGTQQSRNAIVSVVKDISEWGNEFTSTEDYGITK